MTLATSEPVTLIEPPDVMVAVGPACTAPMMPRLLLSISVRPFAVKLESEAIVLLPVKAAAPVEEPDSVPTLMAPVSLMVPLLAIDAALVAAMLPGMVMLLPDKPTEVPVTVPLTVSALLSAIAALGPPETVPNTDRAMLSASENPPAAEKPLSVLI